MESNQTKQKIRDKFLEIIKRHKESKQDTMHLHKKEEEEAQELFDNISLSSHHDQLAEESGHRSSSPDKEEPVQIVSILKKQPKSDSDNKKTIRFGEDKVFIISDGNRKWNEKLKSPRKGKFDPNQKRALIQNLNKCLTDADLTYEEVVKAMSEDQEKIPRNLNFWTKVCSILEDRSLMSSYKFLQRELSTKNKGGEWSSDETDMLMHFVEKFGRKWSLIAKEMKRTSENVRDKYRQMDQQKKNEEQEKNIWKFQDLVKYLRYLQKYSQKEFIDERLFEELENGSKHDEMELKQLKYRKYNSKTFNFHNNEVARKYLNRQFNQLKMEDINWQKISDKLKTKSIFDCRNKFVQLLQLEIHGIGSKQFHEKQLAKFIADQKPRHEGEIKWNLWRDEQISVEEAKNRWMILKRHIQGRGTKSFSDLIATISQKYGTL